MRDISFATSVCPTVEFHFIIWISQSTVGKELTETAWKAGLRSFLLLPSLRCAPELLRKLPNSVQHSPCSNTLPCSRPWQVICDTKGASKLFKNGTNLYSICHQRLIWEYCIRCWEFWIVGNEPSSRSIIWGGRVLGNMLFYDIFIPIFRQIVASPDEKSNNVMHYCISWETDSSAIQIEWQCGVLPWL